LLPLLQLLILLLQLGSGQHLQSIGSLLLKMLVVLGLMLKVRRLLADVGVVCS
jgi:hypothetical protein